MGALVFLMVCGLAECFLIYALYHWVLEWKRNRKTLPAIHVLDENERGLPMHDDRFQVCTGSTTVTAFYSAPRKEVRPRA